MNENNATSLNDFEKQLKQNLQPSSPAVRGINPTVTPTGLNNGQVNPQKQTVKIRKNMVVSYISDCAGVGHIRNIFPFTYLHNLYGKQGTLSILISPYYLRQVDLLARCRSLFFQRPMNEQQYHIIKNYKDLQKDLKYKMIFDLDDNVFFKNEAQGGSKDNGVPLYNFGSKNIDDNIRKFCPKIMELMNTCCFSTQYLRDKVVNEIGIQTNCTVLPNAIPKFFWGNLKRPDRKKRKEKLKILITSSPTHYSNELKMKGDFDNAWYTWLIKSIKQDRISLVVMGGMPWFLEEVKDKIKVINWVDSFSYHITVKNQRADLLIGPLVPNEFNHCKSDIKYIEASAASIPFIGTVFTNGKPSPYDKCLLTVRDDCTVDDIEEIVEKLKGPEFYNKIKNEQFDMLEKKGRWLESPSYIKQLLSII